MQIPFVNIHNHIPKIRKLTIEKAQVTMLPAYLAGYKYGNSEETHIRSDNDLVENYTTGV